MSTETIGWLAVRDDERHTDCEGYNGGDGGQCRNRPTKRDPRDGGLYCGAHAAAIGRHGVDGRYARVTR